MLTLVVCHCCSQRSERYFNLVKAFIFISLATFLAGAVLRAQVTDEVPDKATALFDSPTVVDIKLTFAPGHWETLQANFMDDTYYAANFEAMGAQLNNVAVRSRGNGSRNAVKPALKVAFDKNLNQEFLGLDTLQLINLAQDPPMLRDWLAMQAMRRMGAPAPRSKHVRVFVNDQYQGLYLAVEAVEKKFVKRVFGDNDGWLYDFDHDGTTYGWQYLGPDAALYPQFQLETNKSKPNFDALLRLIQTLDTTTPEQFIEEMAPLIDIENLIRHLALEVYLADMDGFVGDFGTNNFFIYEGAADARFRLIPWDKSATLFYYNYPIFRNVETNVLTRKLLEVPMLRIIFLQQLYVIADTLGGQGSWLDHTADYAIAQIQEPALADDKKPYSNAEFEQSIVDIKYFINERYFDVMRQVTEHSAAQIPYQPASSGSLIE